MSTLFAPLAAAALGVEAAFGYPAPLYRVLGHPVTWMGALLTRLETRLNHGAPRARRAKGALTLFLLLAAAALPALVLQRAFGGSWPGVLVLAVLDSSLLAQRSLYEHV